MASKEIQDILSEIKELGYISIRDGKIISTIPPRSNLCYRPHDNKTQTRWAPILKYLKDYSKEHTDFGGEFFLCLYDGWREYSEPSLPPQRTYKPWGDVNHSNYLGHGSFREPRFRHLSSSDVSEYPELPLKIISYNRHIDDRNVLLIPDVDFINAKTRDYMKKVDAADVAWEHKIDKIVWRGFRNEVEGYECYRHNPYPKMHLRSLAVAFSQRPECSSFLDASFSYAPLSRMLRHKYLLDIDGLVNAWSALVWKMYSNSAVIKIRSHWEQWYYHLIKPYHHYIPLDNFYGLPDLYKRCIDNDALCRKIVIQGREFISSLTYEYAVKEYTIR